MQEVNWILCPICGNKTRDKIREDTILKNFPLFCPKCKSECLIDVEQFHIHFKTSGVICPYNLKTKAIYYVEINHLLIRKYRHT